MPKKQHSSSSYTSPGDHHLQEREQHHHRNMRASTNKTNMAADVVAVPVTASTTDSLMNGQSPALVSNASQQPMMISPPHPYHGGGDGFEGDDDDNDDDNDDSAVASRSTLTNAKKREMTSKQQQHHHQRVPSAAADSNTSKMSDTSMDSTRSSSSIAVESSVLEYSTDDHCDGFSSDDGGVYFRQDPFTSNNTRRAPPSLLNDVMPTSTSAGSDTNRSRSSSGSNSRRRQPQQRQNHHHHGHDRVLSRGSAMRELRRMGSRSSRIVQFQSTSGATNSDLSLEDSSNSNSNNNIKTPNRIVAASQLPASASSMATPSFVQYPNVQHTYSDSTGSDNIDDSDDNGSSRRNNKKSRTIRNLMAKVAYAIRSPSGIHHDRKAALDRDHMMLSSEQQSSTWASARRVSHIKQQYDKQHDRHSLSLVQHSIPPPPTPPSTSQTQLPPRLEDIRPDINQMTPFAVVESADSGHATSNKAAMQSAAKSSSPTKKNSPGGGHVRKPSSGTTEYPYSMMHLMRDPLNTSNSSPHKNSDRDNSMMVQLNPSSPLLPRHVKATDATSPQGQPRSSLNTLVSDRNVYPTKSIDAARQYGTNYSINDPLKLAMNGVYDDDSSVFVDDYVDEDQSQSVMEPLMKFGVHVVSTRPNEFLFTSRTMAATVAAYFLLDYESSRPPTLPAELASITPRQLALYRFHFSWMWRWFVNAAIVALFMSHTQNRRVTAIMNTCVIVVFAVEVHNTEMLYGTNPRQDRRHGDRRLVRPMAAFLFFLGLESWTWYLFSGTFDPDDPSPPLFSSMFKPLVFFYVSSKARDSLEALARISNIVVRVLAIEFFLILSFAAVGCRMLGHRHDTFHNLSTSWLSLFELATTVNNPSLWMPMYEEARTQAIYFVVFIVTCVIYYHSLVLSVVFQTYIQAMTEIHERSVSDREDAIRLAFLALINDPHADYISTSSVKKCLQVVRPHYSSLKLKALIEIVDPANQRIVDYPSFRTKIRQALNASIRTARSATSLAMGVELIAVVVAVLNFSYVILVTSEWDAAWFESAHIVLASVITVLGLLELLIRFNPLRVQHFTPITRLNLFFDGLALVAALLSCIGIVQYAAGFDVDDHTDYLLMGRAMDMVRVMRFFPIFRDVVRRSSDVLPAMAGPLVLLLSVIHIFVFFGMAMWSGAIDVEAMMANPTLTPLYCLNNFNSYSEGLVTVFNLLIVNDWQEIAEVYLYAEWNSRPIIVYPFFVAVISIGVFIMLNVITAFFVESFVTKRHDILANAAPTETGDDKPTVNHRDFQIRTGENTNVRRSNVSTRESVDHSNGDNEDDNEIPDGLSTSGLDQQSTVSSTGSGEVFAFDIYEREGYDNIMATVAGLNDDEQEAFARSVCNYLEVFESLASGREKVGYMVCCQQSTQRFGNRRFQNNAAGFLTDDMLHQVVSYMHSEMLVLTIRKNTFEDRCLVRTFPHQSDPTHQLEITATLLRYQPAATLFVSRIRLSVG